MINLSYQDACVKTIMLLGHFWLTDRLAKVTTRMILKKSGQKKNIKKNSGRRNKFDTRLIVKLARMGAFQNMLNQKTVLG
jgi:hypothetical protein